MTNIYDVFQALAVFVPITFMCVYVCDAWTNANKPKLEQLQMRCQYLEAKATEHSELAKEVTKLRDDLTRVVESRM